MNRSFSDAAVAGSATPNDADTDTDTAPDGQPAERPDDVEPDSEVGEEDPGAAVDQPAVEPIYPPGTHGH